eukprot:606492-Rhodomonas_salina.1
MGQGYGEGCGAGDAEAATLSRTRALPLLMPPSSTPSSGLPSPAHRLHTACTPPAHRLHTARGNAACGGWEEACARGRGAGGRGER